MSHLIRCLWLDQISNRNFCSPTNFLEEKEHDLAFWHYFTLFLPLACLTLQAYNLKTQLSIPNNLYLMCKYTFSKIT